MEKKEKLVLVESEFLGEVLKEISISRYKDDPLADHPPPVLLIEMETFLKIFFNIEGAIDEMESFLDEIESLGLYPKLEQGLLILFKERIKIATKLHDLKVITRTCLVGLTFLKS